jgi:hypothetical protein
MSNIDKIEEFFYNFDVDLVKTRNFVRFTFSNLIAQVELTFLSKLKLETINDHMNKERDKALKYLNGERDRAIQDHNNYTLKNFRISPISTYHIVKYLVNLSFKNDLSLRKKVIYLNLMNSFREINLNLTEEYSEIKAIPFSRNSIFLFLRTPLEKETFMKILDSNGEVQFNRKVKHAYYYDQFMTFEDKYIFSELYDFDLNKYVLEAFDSKLNLISFRRFNFMIKLCSVNQNEIICLQYIQQKIIIFDFKFVELFRFDKQKMYGSIETYSMNNLFSSDSFYYYSIFLDYSKKKAIMNAIKKDDLDLENSLELELASGIKSISWIVFNMSVTNKNENDKSHSFLLVKMNDILKLVSLEGKHLEQAKNVNIKKFNSLSICSLNEIFFFDANKRKLLFI